MLLVRTYLAASAIHGIGLFAAEPIAGGTTIWEFTPGFDLDLSEADLDRLSKPCRVRVLEYAYFNAARQRYILCSDDARFINHSDTPNTIDRGFGAADAEGTTVAARDIQSGEEITSDYRSFETSERIERYGVRCGGGLVQQKSVSRRT